MRKINFKSLTVIAAISFVILSLVFLVGCVKKKDGEIEIGVILPLTGPAANQGNDSLRGIQMRLQQYKSGRYGVKLIVEDDKSDSKTALSSFKKLIDVDHVPVIIGPITSGLVLALAPEVERSKVVLLAIGASSPKISQAGDYVFRHALMVQGQAEAMANFCFNKLINPKVGILYINDETGMAYADYFSKAYTALNGKIIATESFDRGSSDYRTQLQKIKASGATVLYAPGVPQSTGYILKQTAELGFKCNVLAGYGVEGQDVIDIAGDEAERLIYTSFPYDEIFRKMYKKAYDRPPSVGSGLAYDAMSIVLSILDKGATAGPNLKDALYKEKYQGVTGNISFDVNGDTLKEPIILMTVRKGAFVKYGK